MGPRRSKCGLNKPGRMGNQCVSTGVLIVLPAMKFAPVRRRQRMLDSVSLWGSAKGFPA